MLRWTGRGKLNVFRHQLESKPVGSCLALGKAIRALLSAFLARGRGPGKRGSGLYASRFAKPGQRGPL